MVKNTVLFCLRLTLLTSLIANAFECPKFYVKLSEGFWGRSLIKGKHALNLGQKVELRIGEESQEAYFIGRSPEQNTLSFANTDGQITTLLADTPSLTIESKQESINPLNSSPVIAICHQTGGTCAVHATVNGIKQLRALDGLSGVTLAKLPSDESLFDGVANSNINNEVRERAIALQARSSGGGFWSGLKAAFSIPSQQATIEALMKQLSIPFVRGDSNKQLVQHLKQRAPAILFTSVAAKESSLSVKKFRPNDVFEGRGHPLQPNSNGEDHAVLAVGFIETGIFSGKIIVADSGIGQIYLWDIKDWKRSGGQSILLKTTENQ